MKNQITDSDIAGALTIIKHDHDPVAALSLVKYFYKQIDDGSPFNEYLLIDYIHHAFGKIVNDGLSADHAFGFKQTRGKYKREDTIERDVAATAIVILLMRSGKTWLEAKGEAANDLFPDGTGEKAIEVAYSQYKAALQHLASETLKEMIA